MRANRRNNLKAFHRSVLSLAASGSLLMLAAPAVAQVAGGTTATEPCNQNTATGAMACMPGSSAGADGNTGPGDSGGAGSAGGQGGATDNVAIGENSSAGDGGNGGAANSGGTGGVGGAGGIGNLAFGMNSSAGSGGNGGEGTAGGFGGTGGAGGNNNIAIGNGSSAGTGGTGGTGCCGFSGTTGVKGTDNNIALGSNALANGGGSVALGAQSVTAQANTISFGHAATDLNSLGVAFGSALNRRLINVAAGINATDAVNKGQLDLAISGIDSYSGWNLSADGGATSQAIADGDTVDFAVDDANGNLTVTRSGNTITYGFSSAPTFAGLTVGGAGANFTIVNNTIVNMGGNVVGGVANGVASSDAVNKGQLDAGLTVANNKADAAQATANQALNDAATAQSTANTALSAANAAQATANTAVTKADAAQATANTALSTANNAVGTANTYTDTRETAIRADMTTGDAQTLSSAKSYTDSKFAAVQQNFDSFRSDVWQRMDQTDRRIDRNGAMQSAMAQMTASAAGVRTVNRMAVGVGVQNGQTALSVGYQRAVGDKAAFTIGGAFSGNDRSAGVGYGWGW